MVSFIVRRGMGMLISTFLVISITFAFMQMIPGDPADVLLGPNATPEQIASLRATWGLDQSIWVQYYRYIVNFLHGDLGESLFSRQPVLRMIGQHAETSVFLGIMALLVVVGLGIPAGVISSIRPNSWTDNTLLLVALTPERWRPLFATGLLAALVALDIWCLFGFIVPLLAR